MKAQIVSNTELPGGFVLEAENPAEILVLRSFCNEKRDIYISSFGGNVGEGRMSLCIRHRPDKEIEIPAERLDVLNYG